MSRERKPTKLSRYPEILFKMLDYIEEHGEVAVTMETTREVNSFRMRLYRFFTSLEAYGTSEQAGFVEGLEVKINGMLVKVVKRSTGTEYDKLGQSMAQKNYESVPIDKGADQLARAKDMLKRMKAEEPESYEESVNPYSQMRSLEDRRKNGE